MKKSHLILVFLVFFFTNSYTQIQFYISPSISTKTNEGRLFDNIYHNPKYLPTPYFTYYNPGITYIANLNFGIGVGIIYKYRHFFEFGFSNSNSGNTFGFIVSQPLSDNSININKQFYPTTGTGNFTRYFTKFSIDYNYQFFRSKNKIFSSRLISGIGLFFNKNVKGDNYPIDTYQSTLNIDDPDKNIFFHSYEYEIADIQRISPNITLGIGFDFYTKKNRNLFSIDFSYTHNFFYMTSITHDITVIDNSIKKNYTIDLGSRGSGFLLKISRRFQLYPWIPLSKKKRLAIKKNNP